MRRQRREAQRQLALAADEDARDRGLEIVVRRPVRDRAEVLERAHVPVEEAHLVLPRVEPREVAARVHQPHHEHPRLLPLAGDVDEHLEEIDLRQVARLVHQRDEHLLPSSLPLGHHLADHALADVRALVDEQPVQPRGRQTLLAARPAGRLVEQRLQPWANALLHRASARHRPAHARLGVAVHVPPHRIARNAHLPRHPAHRDALHEHLVSNHVGLVHPQHPPAEPPPTRVGNFPLAGVDQFQAAERITFAPP